MNLAKAGLSKQLAITVIVVLWFTVITIVNYYRKTCIVSPLLRIDN